MGLSYDPSLRRGEDEAMLTLFVARVKEHIPAATDEQINSLFESMKLGEIRVTNQYRMFPK